MEGRKISFGFGWRIEIPDTRQRQNPRLFVFPTPITSSIDKKRHEHTSTSILGCFERKYQQNREQLQRERHTDKLRRDTHLVLSAQRSSGRGERGCLRRHTISRERRGAGCPWDERLLCLTFVRSWEKRRTVREVCVNLKSDIKGCNIA